jgi:hypothetical protein
MRLGSGADRRPQERLPVNETDLKRIEAHLKRTFGNPHVALKARPKQKDSAEVELKGEFIGVIYEDEDEAGSFLFEMAILAEDLE